MNKSFLFIAIAILATTVSPIRSVAGTTNRWWNTSYQDGGGYWPHRVRVTIQGNIGRTNSPVALTVGQQAGQLPLAGDPVQSVRIVDDQGRELVYGIDSAGGAPLRSGILAAGDRILIPATDNAGATRTVYIYSGNKQAGPLSEYLPSTSTSLLNGGFESGKGDGWLEDGGDNEHHLNIVSDVSRTGHKSARMMADSSATATWFGFKQTVAPVTPGNSYVFHAWVKAENVAGNVGWYIHVNDASSMVINNVISTGAGSYDWKQVEFRFTLPPDSQNIEIGTALYGTGRAWYDDATLEKLADASVQPTAQVGDLESANLRNPLIPKVWNVPDAVRVPLRIYHFEDSQQTGTIITAKLTRSLVTARRGMNPNIAVYDARTGARCPVLLRDGKLIFRGTLLPRSRDTFYAYIGGTSKSSKPMLSADDVLLPRNLVQNADFADGADTPTGWTYSGQGMGPAGSVEPTGSRVIGGKLGKYALQTIVPASSTPHWYGWHQTIPADAGATYLIGAWMKTANADGDISLYGHIVDSQGKLVSNGPYFGASPSLTGTQGWTWVQTELTMPPDAAGIELHLTSNIHGKIWYDGVVVKRYADSTSAAVQDLESPSHHGLSVWEMPVTIKVFRDDPIQPQPTSVAVALARNEQRSIQLVLKDDTGAKKVSVHVTPLRNASGQALPSPNLFGIGYVPIDYPTSYYQMTLPKWQRKIPTASPASDGWPGEWPDPMPPLTSLDLSPGLDQPVWITIKAPSGAAPGAYHGAIVIASAGSSTPVTIPLNVEIHRFEIPRRPSLAIIYEDGGARRRDASDDYRLMAQYRGSAGDLPDPVMKLLPNGETSMDFTEFDKQAKLCFDDLEMSCMWSPSQFYALGWEFSPRDFLGLKAFTPEWKKAFGSAIRQFSDHMKAHGWDKYMTFYLSDEPHVNNAAHVASDLQHFSKFVQDQGSGMPIYSSTWEYFRQLIGAVTLWGVGARGTFPLDEMAKRKAAGDKFWFTTDGTQCIDTPYTGSERLLGWWCYKYGVLGHEFWGLAWYTYDPWKYGWHNSISQRDSETSPPYFIRYPNGDGYVIYPGKDVGQVDPVASIRLAGVRDGEYDYEYFRLLQQSIDAAKKAGRSVAAAQAVMDKALALIDIPNAGGLQTTQIMADPKAFLTVRDEMADQIDKLE